MPHANEFWWFQLLIRIGLVGNKKFVKLWLKTEISNFENSWKFKAPANMAHIIWVHIHRKWDVEYGPYHMDRTHMTSYEEEIPQTFCIQVEYFPNENWNP